MEVFVNAPFSRCSAAVFPEGSAVRDILTRFTGHQGASSSEDFYIVTNGRLSDLQDPLQRGSVYHLQPRLCGGKGGFGSMLRALGAQIEKTTNREACRDLSGRRLRDVNHEKEMAEWLKKQAEREAEKEQRRLERLQRKLSEPKHHFTDAEYQQQCHDLSERLEDSVLKGLQASSSTQVKADDVSALKRASSEQSEQPHEKKKKKKKMSAAAAAACFWTGVGELLSSEEEEEEEEEDEDEEDESPSTSSSSCGAAAVTVTTKMEEEEEQSSSSSSTYQTPVPSEKPRPSEEQPRPSEEQPRPSEMTGDKTLRLLEDLKPEEESSCPPQQQGSSSCLQLDVSSVASVSELEALGLDVLKEALMSRGMKCGGTLTERAARLFSVRGLSPDQIDPALLAKPAKTKRK